MKINTHKANGIASLAMLSTISFLGISTDTLANERPQKLTAEIPLYTFEDGVLPSAFDTQNTHLQLVKNDEALDGEYSLKVAYKTKKNNTARFAITPNSAFEWGKYKDFHIAFDIKNTGSESVAISLIMGDVDGYSYERGFVAPVGEKVTVYAKMDGHDQYRPALGYAN
ncbi:hypothetical protein RS130_09110 [Paraglaciecola aquimarina]|uniref:Agarase CBM-like domain-containing protein n=1 Tax=Paraglaciecola aquimarina TaxID=1235557 RepID=A0ABU3SVM4_9ALTE|nr:hypothetical protein [Paraglaciecola aquimarina]MDU0354075.1 hypothetical protein [Paraglaciecola aquimarina]